MPHNIQFNLPLLNITRRVIRLDMLRHHNSPACWWQSETVHAVIGGLHGVFVRYLRTQGLQHLLDLVNCIVIACTLRAQCLTQLVPRLPTGGRIRSVVEDQLHSLHCGPQLVLTALAPSAVAASTQTSIQFFSAHQLIQ